MKWLKELFFYDAETFTWSQFVFDACIAFSMLIAFVASIWIAYAFFG